MTIQELRKAQSEEEGIATVANLVENKQKPTRRERARLPTPAKRLVSQWDKLSLRDGLLVRKAMRAGKEVQQLVLPQSLKELAMQELHNKMGHLGPERTLDLLRQRFHWPKMEESVREWCNTCERCCLRQPARTAHRVPLTTIHTSRPLELVSMDFLTLEKSKEGIENVLVLTDHFTRFAQAYPTRDQKASTRRLPRCYGRNSFATTVSPRDCCRTKGGTSRVVLFASCANSQARQRTGHPRTIHRATG